jgi:hypothetical protein
MFLHRKDIRKIQEVLDKFPELEVFELEQSGHSGIGSITTITFAQKVNGIEGKFDIEISGVEDW